jgi:hypothetical protein
MEEYLDTHSSAKLTPRLARLFVQVCTFFLVLEENHAYEPRHYLCSVVGLLVELLARYPQSR